MTTDLRAASDRDWPAIQALLEGHRLPVEGARDHLAHFVVAEREGRVVGVGGLEMYGQVALLRSLATAMPGHGLGTRIVERLLADARAGGAHQVVLLTTTASGFFPRFGFSPTRRDDLPAALRASRELQGACPSSAEVFQVRLVPGP